MAQGVFAPYLRTEQGYEVGLAGTRQEREQEPVEQELSILPNEIQVVA